MSHYATINVKALEDVQVPLVKEALRRMDKRYTVKMLKDLPGVPSFGQNNAALLIAGTPSNLRFNFVQKKDNKVAMTVGGENYRGLDAHDFVKKLTCEYSQVKIEQIAKAQNMIPVRREVKENGDVVMRFALAG